MNRSVLTLTGGQVRIWERTTPNAEEVVKVSLEGLFFFFFFEALPSIASILYTI